MQAGRSPSLPLPFATPGLADGQGCSAAQATQSPERRTGHDHEQTGHLYPRNQPHVADLGKGVRPWLKPWSAGNAEGRITLPCRHNGIPYRGVNVLLLWCEAIEKGYASPLWMTYKQAEELGAHVRKGEDGALVVYADRFNKTETNDKGEGVERLWR